ncbi:MAG: histidine triad protein [Parcubacteria group bacterium]|nr:histidine triad protein [Parcubacteria group bacterium]
MDCIFCKIASHEVDAADIFFEDDNVFVMLDRDWAVKGHALVIWKEHALNMSDLSREDFLHFSDVVRKTEKALLETLVVDKSVVLKSGGIVSHFHFHIYPILSSMSWEAIQALFSKEVRNEPKEGESKQLVADLQLAMGVD